MSSSLSLLVPRSSLSKLEAMPLKSLAEVFHIYHWIIAIVLGFIIWIVAFIARLLPDGVVPQLGKKNAEEQNNDTVEQVKKQGSGIGVKMRGSFRSQSKQGSLRKQASDKAGSMRKQQSS